MFSAPHVFAQDVQVPTEGSGDGGIPRWRLPVKISVSVNGGYDDNPNGGSSGSSGSAFVGAGLNLSYDFGTLRTRASLQSGTGFTYFPDLTSNRYDPNLFLNLSVTHQVNLRATLTAAVSVSYRSEPDFSNTLSLDRRMGNYFSTSDSLSLSYQWLPRISTATSYSLGTVLYDDTSVADTHNRVDQSFSQSIRFLYLPVTTLVVDYGLSASLYNGGLDRNSLNQTLLVGFDHTVSPKLQGFLRGGIEFRTTDNSVLQNNDGLNPHFEGGLTYSLTGKTTLSWNASYGTQESYVPLSSASLTFSTGLVASHVFTPRISANLACYYRHNNNGGVEIFPGIDTSFNEDSLDLSLGLSYSINRFLSATAGYSHTEVQSDLPDRSYSRNSYSGGLSIHF